MSKLIKERYNITQEQKNAIVSISINPKNIVEFGSWTLKNQPYPADIDLFEDVTICCSKKNLGEIMAKKIKEIVTNLPNIYIYSELKAGLDQRFNLDIGEYLNYKIIGFDSLKVKLNLLNLYKNQLLSLKEYNEMNKLASLPLKKDNWDKLFKLLRDKFIIRWTKKEIINGYKMLIGNKKILLKDALQNETPVKIDIIALIDCVYTEITNFYILKYQNKKNGKEILSNLPKDYYKTIGISLLEEIDKLLFNKQYFSPFKAVKRMYSFARLAKDETIKKNIIPLLKSDVSRLYQIKSNIDTLIIVLKDTKSNEESFKKEKPPPFGKVSLKEIQYIRKSFIDLRLSNILKEIDNFKLRLSYIIEFNIPKDIFNKIDYIIQNRKRITYDQIIKKLEEILEILKKIIKDQTLSYLENINYYPKLPFELSLNNKNLNINFKPRFKKGYLLSTTYEKIEPPFIEKIIYPK